MIEWAVSWPLLEAGRYQAIALHMFAHGGMLHLAFNMMALIALGPAVMDRIGPLKLRNWAVFFGLFFATGLCGLGLWLAFNMDSNVPMLGASGAIFGLLGFLLRLPDPDGAPIPLVSRATGSAFVTWLKLHIPLLVIVLAPMLLGGSAIGLAWESHLGGFIGGLLLTGPLRALADPWPKAPTAGTAYP